MVKNQLKTLFKTKDEQYHSVLILFSVIILVGLFIESSMSSITQSIFHKIHYGISTLFIVDFFYRFFKSKDKVKFLKTDWIDLVLSIPFYPGGWQTAILALRCLKEILEFVLVKLVNAFHSMIIIAISLIIFSSVSILQFEIYPECNIKNMTDAVWWSLCTITTVGYGDKFPITGSGKIIATILMISGIALFGTLIGYMSSYLIDKEKDNNNTIDTIEELSKQIKELKETIDKK